MIWPALKRWPDTTSICRKCTLNYSPCAVVAHIHNKKSDHTFFCCRDCCWARHSNCCVNVDTCSVLFSGFCDRAVGYLVKTGLLTWIYLFIFFFLYVQMICQKQKQNRNLSISVFIFRALSFTFTMLLLLRYNFATWTCRHIDFPNALRSRFFLLSVSRYSEIWNESLEWFFPGEIIKKNMHTKLLVCYRNLLPE